MPLLVVLASCGVENISSSSSSSSTSASSGTSATTALSNSSDIASGVTSSTSSCLSSSTDPLKAAVNKSLESLSSAFDVDIKMTQSATDSENTVKYLYTGSNYSFLNSDEKAVSYKDYYYNSETGEKTMSGTKTTLFRDEDDSMYSESLNYRNIVTKDYADYSKIKFSSAYTNPFASLTYDNFKLTDDGTYAITGLKARSFVTALQYSISADVSIEKAYFTFTNNSLQAFDLQIESYVSDGYTYTLSFHVDIKASGEAVTIDHIMPIEDDGTDKTALKASFDKIGNNFTLTFDFKETDEVGYDEPYTSMYYYDGTKIFNQHDSSMGDSLDSPDTLFYPGTDDSSVLLRAIYSSTSSSFDPNGYSDMNYTPISYAAHLPQLGTISTNFFTTNADGGFVCLDSYKSLLFSYLEPYNERRALFADSATSIKITIDNDGNPVIGLGYSYDLYDDGELSVYEVTITFSNIGTTVLPTYVSSVPILSK